MDLRHAIAVVTGAGVGSGLAIAERLLDEGARVVLTDLEETAALAAVLERADDAVVDLVRDEDAAGRVVVLERSAA